MVLTAANIAFEPTELAAPAGAAFAVQFRNADAGVPHNLEIVDPSGQSVFRGEIVVGPAVVSYAIPALGAGRYTFHCTVHPNMTGTLAVGG